MRICIEHNKKDRNKKKREKEDVSDTAVVCVSP